MSTAYELQIYQNGQWQFDSYFDDREEVVSEAERMNRTGRYAGVRVLRESYKEDSNSSEYHVIFSRLGKDTSSDTNWRERYTAPSGAEAARETPRRYKTAPRRPPPKKSTSPIALLGIATALVLIGIATIIGLRTIAGLG